jgi:filamentous hemagglutinin family protein
MAKHAPYRVQTAYRAQAHFIRPTAAALAVAACFSGPVLANPTNPTVVHGTATFATAGNILNITNSHNAIINWGSFSIGINELTRFIQPSALSAVLNRVTGQDPSAILGALQSNGRVFLLNPNGIVFGAGAQINVAGLVASTLNLSNDDFLNNRMRFTDGAGAGSVVNQYHRRQCLPGRQIGQQ